MFNRYNHHRKKDVILLDDECVIRDSWVRGDDIIVEYLFTDQIYPNGNHPIYTTSSAVSKDWNGDMDVLWEKRHRGIVTAFYHLKGRDISHHLRFLNTNEITEFRRIIREGNQVHGLGLEEEIFAKPIRRKRLTAINPPIWSL